MEHVNPKVELSLPLFCIYIDKGNSSGKSSWIQEGDGAYWEYSPKDFESYQGKPPTLSSCDDYDGSLEHKV